MYSKVFSLGTPQPTAARISRGKAKEAGVGCGGPKRQGLESGEFNERSPKTELCGRKCYNI